LDYLSRAEAEQATAKGIAWFKFSEDEAMLAAIDEQKERAGALV